jgi:hypothetical protein
MRSCRRTYRRVSARARCPFSQLCDFFIAQLTHRSFAALKGTVHARRTTAGYIEHITPYGANAAPGMNRSL